MCHPAEVPTGRLKDSGDHSAHRADLSLHLTVLLANLTAAASEASTGTALANLMAELSGVSRDVAWVNPMVVDSEDFMDTALADPMVAASEASMAGAVFVVNK